jgi:hypothetical protein
VVLASPSEPPLLGGVFTADASPERVSPLLGSAQLHELGFAAILREEEIAADKQILASALTDICSRTGRPL